MESNNWFWKLFTRFKIYYLLYYFKILRLIFCSVKNQLIKTFSLFWMTPDSSFWDFPGFSLHMWSIKQHFNVSLISGFKPRFIYILRRHIKQNEQSIKLVSFYCCIDLYNGNISVKVVVILNSLKVTSTIMEWNNLQM